MFPDNNAHFSPSSQEHAAWSEEETVCVVTTTDGAVIRVEITEAWEEEFDPDELVTALLVAYHNAQALALHSYAESLEGSGGNAVADANDLPSLPSIFAALRRYRQDQGDAAAHRVHSRLVQEAQAKIDAANSPHGPHSAQDSVATFSGTDESQVVTVIVDQSGRLANIEINESWVSARNAQTITEHINQAVTAAHAARQRSKDSAAPQKAAVIDFSSLTDPAAIIYQLAQ
jgi:DNA-binding protein YbaB